MRAEYCVVHSQVAFVIQDATCAINHPSRIVRVDVKGQVPQSSSQATAEAAKAKARAIRRGKSMHASASCYTYKVNIATCRQLQEEALHSTLVVPRENHTVGGGHGCRFRFQLWWDYQDEKLTPERDLQSAGKGRSLTLSTPTELPRLWLRSV